MSRTVPRAGLLNGRRRFFGLRGLIGLRPFSREMRYAGKSRQAPLGRVRRRWSAGAKRRSGRPSILRRPGDALLCRRAWRAVGLGFASYCAHEARRNAVQFERRFEDTSGRKQSRWSWALVARPRQPTRRRGGTARRIGATRRVFGARPGAFAAYRDRVGA